MASDTGVKEPRSELVRRVFSSLALAAIALFSAWYGGLVFAVVWGVAAIAVWREWAMIIGLDGTLFSPALWLGAVGIIASLAIMLFPLSSPLLAFLPALLAGIVLSVLNRRVGLHWLWLCAGPAYASAIIVGPLALRDRMADGLVILIWLFLVVWVSDIGAFFAGRGLGGPKLWPSVSPKKTWSGSIGGLIAGTLVPVAFVIAVQTFFGPVWLTGLALIALTLSTALIAEAGDLFESAMKRRFGVKDSGSLIPGHGGLMDRLDSYGAAALYVFLISEILGF
jgi:phosphatidate cytidylyltransferase